MQYVSAIPIFLVIVFGGGYLNQLVHEKFLNTDLTEQITVAPIEQNFSPVQTTPEPAKPTSVVKPSVPTSQPVVKPIEKKKKNDDYISASDAQFARELEMSRLESERDIAERKAEYNRMMQEAKKPVYVAPPKRIVNPPFNGTSGTPCSMTKNSKFPTCK